jgi:hypothetical protein
VQGGSWTLSRQQAGRPHHLLASQLSPPTRVIIA